MACDRFAEDDTSSSGQEGCRTLWNDWKRLPARREGVERTAKRGLEAWETHGEVEGCWKLEDAQPFCGRRYVVLGSGGVQGMMERPQKLGERDTSEVL